VGRETISEKKAWGSFPPNGWRQVCFVYRNVCKGIQQGGTVKGTFSAARHNRFLDSWLRVELTRGLLHLSTQAVQSINQLTILTEPHTHTWPRTRRFRAMLQGAANRRFVVKCVWQLLAERVAPGLLHLSKWAVQYE